MPFDGSGNYTVPAGTVAVPGALIESAKYNAFLADLEAALSAVLLRNGVAAMSAALNMGGYKIQNIAAGSAAADALRYDQVFPTLRSKLLAPTEVFIDADVVMTASWAALTSNLVAIGSGTGTVSITRFGAVGAAFNGPFFIRFTDTTSKLIHSATLLCPGGVDYIPVANDSIILIPFSTTNSATADAYKVVAARS